MKRASSDHSLTANYLRCTHYETLNTQGSTGTPFHYSYVHKSGVPSGCIKGFPEDALLDSNVSCHSSDSDYDMVCTFSQTNGDDVHHLSNDNKSWNIQQFCMSSPISELEEVQVDAEQPESGPSCLSESSLLAPYSSAQYSSGFTTLGNPYSPQVMVKVDYGACSACSSPRADSISSFGGIESDDQHDGDGDALSMRHNHHLTSGHAACELFLRLNHARQTLDFAKRQASLFAELDKGEMGIWQALSMLNELREYEAPLMNPDDESVAGLGLREHALQTAELCRLRYPHLDWLHLVGLIHSLGKLLAHPRFGAQPQWAVCGESFPLGCRFASQISSSQFFSVNPDRRRRLYNTPCGMYQARCGLQNVYMSWGGPEYLYLVLLLNQTTLPPEAMAIIRYQKFASLTHSTAYHHLLSPEDTRSLPLLAEFQQLSRFRRVAMPDGVLQGDALVKYYSGLIAKYIGEDNLFW